MNSDHTAPRQRERGDFSAPGTFDLIPNEQPCRQLCVWRFHDTVSMKDENASETINRCYTPETSLFERNLLQNIQLEVP
mgnify:CR=1 FL=1